MANILYDPDAFSVIDIQGLDHQQIASGLYNQLVGKSILKILDPDYVANFLVDHYASYYSNEPISKTYLFCLGKEKKNCHVAFKNFPKNKIQGELYCHPALLANLFKVGKDDTVTLQQQANSIVLLIDKKGQLFHYSTTTEKFLPNTLLEAHLGKSFFDDFTFTELVSGKKITVAHLKKHYNKAIRVLFVQEGIGTQTYSLLAKEVKYGNDLFISIQLNTGYYHIKDYDTEFIVQMFDEKILQSIIITDMEGNIQLWNKYAEKLYGWTKEEAIGKNVLELIPVTQSIEQATQIMKQLRAGLSWSGTFSAKNKAGKAIQVRVYDSPIMDYAGKMAGIIGVSWDVTQEEKDREAFLLQQELLNNTTQGIIAAKADGKIVYINNFLKSLFSINEELPIEQDILDFFTAYSKDAHLFTQLEKLFHGQAFVSELSFVHQGKKIAFVRLEGKPVIDQQGKIEGITIFISDQADKKVIEDLHQLEVLNKEALINSTTDWMWSVDTDYCLITANSSLLESLEIYFGKKVVTGDFLLDESVYDKDYLEYWKNMYDRVLAGETIIEEFAVPSPEGIYGEMYASVTMRPIINYDSKIVGCACYGRNITSERKAMDLLQTSERRFSTIFSAAPLGIAIIDSLTGKIDDINERFAEIAGRSIEQMRQIDWMQITHPDDVEEDLRNMGLLNAKKISSFQMEKRYIRPDGTVVWVHMSIKPIEFEQYTNPHHLCMIQDITSKKSDQEFIRLSNERYELAVKATNDMIWDWDVEQDIVYRNGEHFVQITGLPQEDKDRNGNFWMQHVHADDLPIVQDAVQLITNNPDITTFDVEYRFRKPDGTYAYLNDRGYAKKDQFGKLVRVIGSVADITEKKQYQEELERLSLIATKTSNAVIITDKHEKVVWVNEAFTKTTGYQLNEIQGKVPGPILQGQDTDPNVKLFMSHRIKQRKAFECEVLNYHKNGTAYWIYLQAQPVFDTKGELKYFFAIQSDITESKRIREEMKRSEAKYRQLFDNSPVNIVIWDPVSMLIKEVNAKALEAYSLKREAFIGTSYLQLHDEATKVAILELADQVLHEESFYHQAIYTCRDRQHKLLYMQLSFHRIEYDGNVAIMAIGNNITEQVELERTLSEERKQKQDELTMAVLSAQDKERTNLGQELHDNVNQLLSVAKMYLSLSKKQDSRFAEHIQMVDNTISEAIADIRNISHELILPRFSDGDFGMYLDELFQRFSTASKIPIEVNFKDATVQGANEGQLLAIYRILQEQLNNVIKYAKASTVFVDFKRVGKDLFIELKDDGVGFNLAANKKGGVGFTNMTTRANLNGGSIRVESAEGKGCTIKLHFTIPSA